jgi:hypothetical protein
VLVVAVATGVSIGVHSASLHVCALVRSGVDRAGDGALHLLVLALILSAPATVTVASIRDFAACGGATSAGLSG